MVKKHNSTALESGIPDQIGPDDTTPPDTPLPLPYHCAEQSEHAAPQEIVGSAIQRELQKYFSSSEKGGTLAGVTKAPDAEAKWLKWGVGFVVTIFSAGMGYSHWVAGNATKMDLDTHIKNDLVPLKGVVSSVKVSVEALVSAEGKRADREVAAYALDKEMRILEAHRAQYQERMAEYAAAKSEGVPAVLPGKTPEHIAVESNLGILGRD